MVLSYPKGLFAMILMLAVAAVMLAGGVLYLYDFFNERKSNCHCVLGTIADYRQNYGHEHGSIKRRNCAAIVEYEVEGERHRCEFPLKELGEKRGGSVPLRAFKRHPDRAVIDDKARRIRGLISGVALVAVGTLIAVWAFIY